MSRLKREVSGWVPIIAIAIVVLLVLILFLVPVGEYVEAKVEIRGDNLEIIDCYLRNKYILEVLPGENVTQGDKTLILTVSVDGNEIAQARRENLGEGNVTMRTGTLPSTEEGMTLHVVVSLYRENVLLNQASRDLAR